jgi:nitrite reductase/ring-hydroxylating ferredoxin subunit
MREENRLNPVRQTHEELPAGTAVGLMISDEQILLCNVDGLHYAISNICPHGKSLLSEGKLRGHVITCGQGSTFEPASVLVDRPRRVSGRTRSIETVPG